MARRSGRTRTVLALLSIGTIAAAALLWGPGLWERYGDRVFSGERCTVTIGGESHELTAEQADNAALIVAVALARGLPERASTIALAAALQESDLRNIGFGDRDSLGLFQQRPSQGWGTAEQIVDRHHATNAFYDALLGVDGWEVMSVTEAAQAVQRSAFPNAYADHADEAALWSAALRGDAGAEAVTCRLDGVTPSPEAGGDVARRVLADFGTAVTAVADDPEGGTLSVRLLGTATVPDEAIAAWGVTVSGPLGIESVSLCPRTWSRTDATWTNAVDASMCAGYVFLTVRVG